MNTPNWYGWPEEPILTRFGKEERAVETEGRRHGGRDVGIAAPDFPQPLLEEELDSYSLAWGRALVMLILALAIFGVACWLLDSHADETAPRWLHACAGGLR